MSAKNFYKTSGTVFGVVGLLHLIRVLAGWSLVAGPYTISMWLSVVAFIVLFYLSYQAFRLAK